MIIDVFGIKNCDKMKKVFKSLENLNVDYHFHDYKKTQPSRDLILLCHKNLGELPVNKRGTTFRKIKESFEVSSLDKQIELLQENSSALIRPIILKNGKVFSIGYDEEKLGEL